MADESSPFRPEDFPSTEAAFAYVIPSYQMMLTRFESAHSRLQQQSALIPTVTFAAVALVKTTAPGVVMGSAWLAAALVLAALATVICWSARLRWETFVQPNPGVLYDAHLTHDPTAFRMFALDWAGDAFEVNVRHVRHLRLAGLVSSVCFGIAMSLLVPWVLQAR